MIYEKKSSEFEPFEPFLVSRQQFQLYFRFFLHSIIDRSYVIGCFIDELVTLLGIKEI